MNGKFITLEGPDGSGKTSVMDGIKKFLDSNNINYITTREPGGVKIAESIRDVILDVENTEMDPHSEALLYAASRSQHFHQKVVPALEQGTVVICDRFIDSSLAYQGHARGLGIDEVYEINKFGIGNKLPDATIFIDVPPSVGLKRLSGRERIADRLDLEDLSFHERVYEGYMIISNKYSDRFKVIDGTQSKEKVIEDAIEIIKSVL